MCEVEVAVVNCILTRHHHSHGRRFFFVLLPFALSADALDPLWGNCQRILGAAKGVLPLPSTSLLVRAVPLVLPQKKRRPLRATLWGVEFMRRCQREFVCGFVSCWVGSQR